MAQSGGTYHAIASTSTLTVQYWGKSKFNTCVYILYCGEELSVTCYYDTKIKSCLSLHYFYR